jgi:hypothetical protein
MKKLLVLALAAVLALTLAGPLLIPAPPAKANPIFRRDQPRPNQPAQQRDQRRSRT